MASSKKLTEEQLHEDNNEELMCQTGARVKVRWTKEDVGDSGWRPGWYTGIVQGYDSENDLLDIAYPCDPGCSYTEHFTELLGRNGIKLQSAAL